MPQQLIYTSAQRGVVAGRSGYCTVARSASMREALMLQLEKLSYYQHLSLIGGQERRISACRILEIRGTRYHVLSRIQDAGLDFTGRTNFIAHHLVFTPEEIRQYASPPIILAKWSGWQTSWTKEPENLENETWGNLSELSSVVSVPAQTWQSLSGEAAHGYGMLEVRAGASFRVDNVSEDQILALFSESLDLLELRDPRRDHCVTAWQYTFTTSMQEQDNPADFKWRCIHADNPASTRFAGPDCRNLTDVKVIRVTNEEKSFAQLGRQAPRITVQPHDVRLKEGEAALLSVQAEGVPTPRYQWYAVDKSGAGQIIPEATGPELSLPNPPFGVSRYVVQVVNSVGEVTSEVAKVECEKKIRLATPTAQPVAHSQPANLGYDPDYELKRDNQRMRYQQEEADRENKNRRTWNKFIMFFGVFVLLALCGIGYLALHNKGNVSASNPSPVTGNGPIPASPAVSNVEPSVAKNTVKSDEFVPKSTSQRTVASDVFSLPQGWSEVSVGKELNHHTDPVIPPYQFDISSVGGAFSTNHDNVIFLCKAYSGNGFMATISKIPTNSPSGLSGIMIRNSGKVDSQFLFIGATAQKVHLYRRGENGAYTSMTVDLPRVSERNVIVFKFEENKGKLVPSWSLDSVKWSTYDQFDLTVATNSLIGFTQAYGIPDSPAKARFVHLTGTSK